MGIRERSRKGWSDGFQARGALAALCLFLGAWAAPAIEGFQPAWARPGEWIQVEGTDLGSVKAVYVGNLKVRSFTAAPGGTGLRFQLPPEWRVRSLSTQVIRMVYREETPEGPGVRKEIQSPGVLFQMPDWIWHPETMSELPNPVIERGQILDDGQGGLLVRLEGEALDLVYEARIHGVDLPLRRVRENLLILQAPETVDGFSLEWDRVTFSFVAGHPRGPESRLFRLSRLGKVRGIGDPEALPVHFVPEPFPGADEGKEEGREARGAGPEAKESKISQGPRIAALHLTQATQTLDGAIPLVQGKDAAVRVFPVGSGASEAEYTVRVTIRNAKGRRLLVEAIPPRRQGLPDGVRPDLPWDSWNLRIPGHLIQPGTTVTAKLIEARTGKVVARHPASGPPQPLDGVAVPPIGITLVPLIWKGEPGNVRRIPRGDWVGPLRRLLPVAEVDLAVAEPVELPVPEGLEEAARFSHLSKALETRRLLDDPWNQRFYVGVVHLPKGGRLGGVAEPDALAGHPVATGLGRTLVLRDSFGAPDTLAHEMGHLFGLDHAPTAGVTTWIDPFYPKAGGLLDVAGFNLDSMQPVPPDPFTDLMGYGEYKWISAYNYSRALAFLTRERSEILRHAGIPSHHPPADRGLERCLLVSGRLAEGRILWDPAFVVPGRPEPPPSGHYQLELLDARGGGLATFPFGMTSGDAGGEGAFEFLIPLSETRERAMDSIRVLEGEFPMPMVEAWTGRALGTRGVHGGARGLGLGGGPQAPVIKRAEGRLKLDWDLEATPAILVLDAGTGQMLGRLGAGVRELPDPGGKAVDLLLSDGLRSTDLRVPIP